MDVNQNMKRYETAFANYDKVEHVDEENHLALVRSKSDANKLYKISFGEIETCDCPDYLNRGLKCWHQRAVELFLKVKRGEVKLMA